MIYVVVQSITNSKYIIVHSKQSKSKIQILGNITVHRFTIKINSDHFTILVTSYICCVLSNFRRMVLCELSKSNFGIERDIELYINIHMLYISIEVYIITITCSCYISNNIICKWRINGGTGWFACYTISGSGSL